VARSGLSLFSMRRNSPREMPARSATSRAASPRSLRAVRIRLPRRTAASRQWREYARGTDRGMMSIWFFYESQDRFMGDIWTKIAVPREGVKTIARAAGAPRSRRGNRAGRESGSGLCSGNSGKRRKRESRPARPRPCPSGPNSRICTGRTISSIAMAERWEASPVLGRRRNREPQIHGAMSRKSVAFDESQ
jgi:hypothetical protein